MKKLLALILCFMTILSFSSCSYNPPEGYSKSIHSYEEILKYAKGIDPNATVSENYTDTEQCGESCREYPAIINGIECHVSSVSVLLSNDGIFAGEFPMGYYRLDTDYDYLTLQQIVAEKQPEWTLTANSYSYDCFLIFIATGKTEELSDEELNLVFQHIDAIRSSYNSFNVRKRLCFGLPSPSESYNADGKLVVNDYTYFQDCTESQTEFVARYRENWSLLNSNMSN